MDILVTGCAGFIGSHVCRRLLAEGHTVAGYDNLNNYYSVSLKKSRLKTLEHQNFIFVQGDLENQDSLRRLYEQFRPQAVIHLAAQAGVRYSLENPHSYIQSNVVGFMNVLENCRHFETGHLIYASTSSVYGLNKNMPFSTQQPVDHPISLYAATKKSNELMAHTYSQLFGLPTTGLRFFTVYGPWGRPDMALFRFTQAILEGKPIQLFNYGRMKRDFTYIDDIVEGIVRLIPLPPKPTSDGDKNTPMPGSSPSPYRIYNIGNHNPVPLLDFITVLEEKLGRAAQKELLPLQPGDVTETYADVTDLFKITGFKPQTSIKDGVGRFVDWYVDYYGKDTVGKRDERGPGE
ncbi:NAD-dependent epimerase [Paenibacillus sp. JX-17]|uniref:NAD-dependent epimerase n=1 Tax=Paenibacillus lacisoli TaxID=3064525 RepID=A0ABT9CI65_9BACL|nr:NAD-dependent epimerase [Paenibacillus sp. JX-17]MDO7907632.1 NAD-dependent epimerase [Paenibacillus sp. JX-17]